VLWLVLTFVGTAMVCVIAGIAYLQSARVDELVVALERVPGFVVDRRGRLRFPTVSVQRDGRTLVADVQPAKGIGPVWRLVVEGVGLGARTRLLLSDQGVRFASEPAVAQAAWETPAVQQGAARLSKGGAWSATLDDAGRLDLRASRGDLVGVDLSRLVDEAFALAGALDAAKDAGAAPR
jgi:hypothetical protein